jgi:hypothetical protein
MTIPRPFRIFTGLLTGVKRRMPPMEQKLSTLLEHMSSLPAVLGCVLLSL